MLSLNFLSKVKRSESCYKLLFLFVKELRVRELVKDLSFFGACFFGQEVVRAAPGPLVASHCFAFIC